MRGLRLLPVALWGVGAVLLADSVLRGGAQVALVVIVPVVSGHSAEFLLGVVFVFAGFLALPWLFLEGVAIPPEQAGAEPERPPLPAGQEVRGGGLILVGPVPILFGGWRNVSRRTRWWLALAGGAILVAFVAVLLFAFL